MTSYMTNTFAKYLRLGITPRPVRGNWIDGDYMYSIYHDDVQYTIDDLGDYEIDGDVSLILECLEAHEMIIERHHTLVKEIYELIKDHLQKDIWVCVGMGMQLHCTFGDNKGAFSHLMLDFINPEKFQQAVDKLKNLIGEEFAADFEEVNKFVLMVTDKDKFEIFKNYHNPTVDVVNLREDLDEY